METIRKQYSLEFKIKAVELSQQRNSVKSVAEELDIPVCNLRRWRAEYSNGRFSKTAKAITKSKEELEIIRLKRELHDAQLERDILKKAVGIFSKSDRKNISSSGSI